MAAREAVRQVHQALRAGAGKIEALLEALTRYGPAIEADLAHHYPGVDLAVLWRRRRWRRLLNLIEHLPAASHLSEVQAADEDLARLLLSRPTPTYKPRISEWNPTVAELANAVDRLGELIGVLVAVNGGRPPQMRPRPRPTTALDRLREQERAEQHANIVKRLVRRR